MSSRDNCYLVMSKITLKNIGLLNNDNIILSDQLVKHLSEDLNLSLLAYVDMTTDKELKAVASEIVLIMLKNYDFDARKTATSDQIITNICQGIFTFSSVFTINEDFSLKEISNKHTQIIKPASAPKKNMATLLFGSCCFWKKAQGSDSNNSDNPNESICLKSK